MPTWELHQSIHLLFKMLEIREKNGIEYPKDLNQLKITAIKSALLQRLLEGKEPFEDPPPLSMSYPWYSLIEDGYGSPWEAWEADVAFFGAQTIVIDQCPWKLIEQLGDRDWVVTYPINRGDFNNPETKFSDTRWRVRAVGCRWPQPASKSDSSNFYWYIEKIS